MKAAVTGATGFIGSHLAYALRRQRAAVACLVRRGSAAAPLEAAGCRIVTGSLADERALAELVADAEVVFHVAGLVAARSEAEFLRVNRDGAARLAGWARDAGVRRFIHVSSLAVTGPSVPGRPLDESGSPNPVTRYGRSKLEGEAAVRESGVPFTIVRPSAVYGPRDRELLRLFRLARRGVWPLLGGGRQELSLIHVADLAAALWAVACEPRAEGRVYHAAAPEIVDQRALAGAIARAVGTPVRLFPLPAGVVRLVLLASGAAARLAGRATLLAPDKAPEILAPAWTCSSAALEKDTGWRAAIPLDRGLAETARWYRENGWL